MAFLAELAPEVLGAGAEGGGAAAGGADFNDMPFGKTMGSSGGDPVKGVVHTLGSIMSPGAPPSGGVNLGAMGNL